jgi:hypothetical protein
VSALVDEELSRKDLVVIIENNLRSGSSQLHRAYSAKPLKQPTLGLAAQAIIFPGLQPSLNRYDEQAAFQVSLLLEIARPRDWELHGIECRAATRLESIKSDGAFRSNLEFLIIIENNSRSGSRQFRRAFIVKPL